MVPAVGVEPACNKTPEDFKFHSNEKSISYTECDELLPSATSATRSWG